MIAKNELRIGNLVLLAELGETQTCIVDIDLLNKIFNDEYYTGIPILQPIPLEPEILEKCGFVDCENAIHDFCWFKIEEDGVDLICDHVKVNKTPIQYLHQLQNLYWCLCGQELEVKLQ